MAASITLTFAELEFLLGSSPRWSERRADLGLVEPEAQADVAAAGLASLVARGLAQQQQQTITLDSAVEDAAALIDNASSWFDVAHVQGETVSAGRLGVSADKDSRVYVAAPGLGCFEVIALLTENDLAAQVADLMAGLAEAQGASSVVVAHRSDAGVAGVVLSVDGHGVWGTGTSGGRALVAAESRGAATETTARALRDVLLGSAA